MAGIFAVATVIAIGTACRDVGFIYIKNHGIPQKLIINMLTAAREFFARPMKDKKNVAMFKNSFRS